MAALISWVVEASRYLNKASDEDLPTLPSIIIINASSPWIDGLDNDDDDDEEEEDDNDDDDDDDDDDDGWMITQRETGPSSSSSSHT